MSRALRGLLNEMVAGVAAYAAHADYLSRRLVTSQRN